MNVHECQSARISANFPGRERETERKEREGVIRLLVRMSMNKLEFLRMSPERERQRKERESKRDSWYE